MIYAPLANSQSYKPSGAASPFIDDNVRLRVSKTIATRAFDLGFYKAIIVRINEDDETDPASKLSIPHELAHIQNGDARYFHLAALAGLISLAMLVQFTALALSALTLPSVQRSAIPMDQRIMTFAIPLASVAAALFFISWIRQSLHMREFVADRAGLEANPEQYLTWLRRQRNRERAIGWEWQNLLVAIQTNFTHPTFERRLAAAQSTDKPIERFRFWIETGRSAVFLYGGILLAFSLFSYGSGIDNWTTLIYIGLTILVIVASVGAVSISAMEAFERVGAPGAAFFLLSFAILNWAIPALGTLIAQSTGTYDALTVGLGPAPEETTSGFGLFFAIFLIGGATLFAFNYCIYRFAGSWRYRTVTHLVAGLVGTIGAFQTPKLLHAIFIS